MALTPPRQSYCTIKVAGNFPTVSALQRGIAGFSSYAFSLFCHSLIFDLAPEQGITQSTNAVGRKPLRTRSKPQWESSMRDKGRPGSLAWRHGYHSRFKHPLPFGMHVPSHETVLVASAVREAGRRSGLSEFELCAALGLPAPTGADDSGLASILEVDAIARSRAIDLIALFSELASFLGNDEVAMRKWLRANVITLESAPVDQIIAGNAKKVIAYLRSGNHFEGT